MTERAGRQDNGLSRYHVPNLERGMAIMELLSRNPQGLTKTEIVEALGCSANSVYRITLTLVELGYLSRHEVSKRFFLTPKMMDLGCATVDDQSVVAVAWDRMCELRDQTRETVLVGTRIDGEGVVLEQALGLHAVRFMIARGVRFELHAAAPGKALIAFLSEAEREALIKNMPFSAHTEHTVTSAEAFRGVLTQVWERGYATDVSEVLHGVHCVAAPVFDRDGRVVAAVWVTAPADRLPIEAFPEMADRVCACAKSVSHQLGHRGAEM